MPRKLRIPKERDALTLSMLGPANVLCLVSAWRPPTNPFDASRSRWRTWDHYLDEYARVRGELLDRFPTTPDGRKPFAERVARFVEDHGGTIDPVAIARARHDGVL